MATYPAPPVDPAPAIELLHEITYDRDDDSFLLLSLGGSARKVNGIRRGENTVLDLAKKVFADRRINPDNAEAVIISGEPIETDVIESGLSGYVRYNTQPFPVTCIQATIPSVEGHVLPAFSSDTALVERKEFLAGATVKSLAASGKETAEGSPLILAFADMLKRFSTIYVHNDLWYEQGNYGCINIYLEQTPSILYALKQAVDNGSTVKFIKLESAKDCSHALGFLPRSPEGVAVWSGETDLRLEEVVIRRGGRSKKRRRVKTNVLSARSRTRRSVSAARFLGR